MKEVERLADELIAGAKEVRMEREMLEKILKRICISSETA